jgi:hypothetical protein
MEALRELWTGAGVEVIETREITVVRTFADFDEFWITNLAAPSVGPTIAAMPLGDAETLKARVQARLPPDAAGRISYAGRANAIKGRKPR